eukprot:1350630-Prymnesium_polylepis.1
MGKRRTFRYRPRALVEADTLACLRASESSDLDDEGHASFTAHATWLQAALCTVSEKSAIYS